MPHLFVFGYGYSAHAIGRELAADTGTSWTITGTRTHEERLTELLSLGVGGVRFDDRELGPRAFTLLRTATHLLVSVPPDAEGDPVLRHTREMLLRCSDLSWVGYLSTSGVYGDHGGAWVDELTPPRPTVARAARRVAAEDAWQALCTELHVPLQIFRLTGIYGPGRSVVDRLRAGTARRIFEPGHVFNRVHVDDIAGVVTAGMHHLDRTGVFNVADDLPSPAEDPLLFAADLMGLPPPPRVSLSQSGLSSRGRSFYEQSRRIRNERAKKELGWRLRYPTYREGITALLSEDG
ncbi:MAG: SDR family oxidoreductase [Longimicrobiales bacterium]